MLDLEINTTMGGDATPEKQHSSVGDAPKKDARVITNGKKLAIKVSSPEELFDEGYPSQLPSAEGTTMKLISGGELKEKLDKGEDIKLVFALGDWQYRAKHIPGSLHFHHLEEALKLLDRDDEIVVYCSNVNCSASIFAYHFLVNHGFTNVRRYAGGLLDWEDAGYPLEGEGLK